MNWWRVAAAVILLLVLGFTVAVLVNKKSVTDENQIVKVPVNKQPYNTRKRKKRLLKKKMRRLPLLLSLMLLKMNWQPPLLHLVVRRARD